MSVCTENCAQSIVPAERANSGQTPLLVFADDWGRHPSSCQHLIRRLREMRPVLWANSIGTRQVKANGFTVRRGIEKLRSWSKGLNQISPTMWSVDLPMLPGVGGRIAKSVNRRLVQSRLSRELNRLGFGRPIVLTTLPHIYPLIRDLPRESLVYYCTDDYSHWPAAERQPLQDAEAELLSDADLVLPVSQALMARCQRQARCHYFPHGVDVQHFATAGVAGDVPSALAELPGPKVGFFGLVYEKLDFELLSAVARSIDPGTLALIGPIAHCPENFRCIPNVRLLGPQPYSELPRWLAGLDVLLLPYVDDEMIRQSNPLKLRECLATGKPTVSVDVPEAHVKLPHVRIAANRDEFVRLVNESLKESPDDPARAARRASVQNDDWDARAADLAQILRELERSRQLTPPGI